MWIVRLALRRPAGDCIRRRQVYVVGRAGVHDRSSGLRYNEYYVGRIVNLIAKVFEE
jgi:hypothetical protein